MGADVWRQTVARLKRPRGLATGQALKKGTVMRLTAHFRRFTSRARMYGSIAIFVLLLGAVGGTGLWGMFRIELSGTTFIEGPFSDAVHLESLYRYVGEARKEEKSMIILFNKDIAQRKTQWKQAMAQ